MCFEVLLCHLHNFLNSFSLDLNIGILGFGWKREQKSDTRKYISLMQFKFSGLERGEEHIDIMFNDVIQNTKFYLFVVEFLLRV